ncbi:MAG: ferredoxin-thioredoxin reductase catalytic domain-containing protein [Candidatus Altiarchaeota archaeon]|nr:ferredoxin-thioredoxin reductase catalytic domain-containing protein [Candidatus Altiarchaeota archaeon]
MVMDKEKYTEAKRKYAERAGFMLNPDRQVVGMIVDGLLDNMEKHGKPYCPCRPMTSDDAENRKNVCPCVYHKDEIAKDGKCHCWLFVKRP